MTQTKKDFFRVGFLRTAPQPCASDEKSAKNLCAEKGTPEKLGIMQKSIFLFLLFFYCLASCQSPSHSILGVKNNTKSNAALVFPFGDDSKYIKMSTFIENDTNFLCLMNIPEKPENEISICLYDLERQVLCSQSKVNASWSKRSGVSEVYAFSKDSVFIQFYQSEHNINDSCFVMANCKGEIKKIFAFDGLPIPTRNKPVVRNERLDLDSYYTPNLPIVNNRFFFALHRLPNKENQHLPIVGVLENNNHAYYLDSLFIYLKEIIENDWAQDYSPARLAKAINGNLLVSFGYTPDIWEWDFHTRKWLVHTIPLSNLLRKAHPMRLDVKKNPEHLDAYEPDAGGYACLYTDYVNKRYVRTIYLPPNIHGLNSDHSHLLGITILDSSFHIIAESIDKDIPPSKMCYNGSDFLYIDFAKVTQKIKAGFMQHVHDTLFVKMVTFDTDKEKTVSENVSKKGVAEYLNAYYQDKIKFKKTVFITTTLNNNCQGCVKNLFEQIATQKNRNIFPHVHTLILDDDLAYAKEYVKVQGWDSPNIFYQTAKSIDSYFYQGYNPKAYFFEKGRLINTVQLTPANEQEVIEQIKKYVK